LANQNYDELEELYKKYSSAGFEVLAFLCNNFANGQKPDSNEDILAFTRKKGVTFTIMGKLECENGDKTHPLYKYLRATCSGGVLGHALRWNYTKFLCNAEGVPVKRYGPMQSPLSSEGDITALLK
jgi:glutathione peroxidase-family protein